MPWLAGGAAFVGLFALAIVVLRLRTGRRLAALAQGNAQAGVVSGDCPAVDEVGAEARLGADEGSVQRFGAYVLLDKIGEGGMAEVFTARLRGARGGARKGPPVVIKRMRPELAKEPEAVRHFRQEGELALKLTHPNIARTFEAATLDGIHYMVQEYVVGRDVGQLTRRMVQLKKRPLSPAAIFHIAHEVLGALEYAHTRRDHAGSLLGLVHRDVSPENILISASGEIKLLDFGIAKLGGLGLATESGAPAPKDVPSGNLDFMSPEQARGARVDARSDLFSLGLVMYYCAARAPLYRGKTLYDQLVAAAAGPGGDALEYVAGLAPPIPELLRDVLSVDPAARPRTAKALRDRLSPHTRGGAAELAAVMSHIFGEKLEQERERAEAAKGSVPAADKALPAKGKVVVPQGAL